MVFIMENAIKGTHLTVEIHYFLHLVIMKKNGSLLRMIKQALFVAHSIWTNINKMKKSQKIESSKSHKTLLNYKLIFIV